MKHIKYSHFFFYALFSIILFSCKRDVSLVKIENKSNVLQAIENMIIAYDKPHDGEILFKNQNTASSNFGSRVDYYNLSSKMFVGRNPDKYFFAGKMFVNNNEVPFIANSFNGGVYGLNADFDSPNSSFLKKVWGTKVAIRVESSGNYRLENDSSNGFYIPMTIEMQATFLNTKQVSLTESNSITWQADPNNPTGKVYLLVVYEGPESKDVNPSFSDSTEIKYEMELPDNGSYTLAANVLEASSLPIGSRMSFYLARGSYQTVTNSSGTEIILQAITYSSSNTLAVKQ